MQSCFIAAFLLTGLFPSSTNIFAPVSTPAQEILDLSLFVLEVTAAVFLVVFSLLTYAVVKFRRRKAAEGREPAQVYGSTQLELAWPVIPVLIVLVLFLASARVIASIQNAPEPNGAIDVTVIGHQFWWEYRYPSLGVVTANELHIPLSDPAHPTPTFLTLLSADTDHSFWVPRLAGKTDLIPNHPNRLWLDPHETGLFLGQCAQYCGTQHAMMLLRVYVQTRDEFDRWVREQSLPARSTGVVSDGQKVFERTACINCHAVAGTAANGRFGPDLTHLMSRDTIASGAVPNTPANLRRWIQNPNFFKPGSKMPAAASRTLAAAERDHIVEVLDQAGWMIGGQEGAATRLGLPRTTLIAKMKKLGIETRRSQRRGPAPLAPSLTSSDTSVAFAGLFEKPQNRRHTMTTNDAQRFRKILWTKIAELERITNQRDGIAIERSADLVEEIQSASERALAVSHLDRDCSQLRNARAALDRIQAGSFGVCQECEEEIHPKRLAAVPWAAFCIHCQEAIDRNSEEFRTPVRDVVSRAA